MNKCPVCQFEQEKLLPGGRCNQCKTPLTRTERKDEQGLVYNEYTVRKGEKEKIVKEEVTEKFDIVFQGQGVKIERSDKNNFIVTFTGRSHFNWVYCPSCESKMFQNDTLKGSMQEKCRKCKAIITYVFN